MQVKATAEALRTGVDSLNDDIVNVIGHRLPEGEYNVVLAEGPVSLVKPGDVNDYLVNEQVLLWGEDNFWCLPHNPRVPYFRVGDQDIGKDARLFNLVVPMFPTKWLTMTTASKYMEGCGRKPPALLYH